MTEPRMWVLRGENGGSSWDPADEIYDGPHLRVGERVEVLEAGPIIDLLKRLTRGPQPREAQAEAVMLLRRLGRG